VELGYTQVKVFAAGYPAWKKYAGSAAAAAVPIKKGAEEGSIAIDQFKEIIEKRPESILLVDVRDKDEYDKGHFKTAVNIPVEELEKKVKSLPTDKPIIFVCSTGARSGESFYMLQDLRPKLKKVYYLEAGCTIKKDGSYEIKKTE
jgi:rhodanese-related sulfurtransferase